MGAHGISMGPNGAPMGSHGVPNPRGVRDSPWAPMPPSWVQGPIFITRIFWFMGVPPDGSPKSCAGIPALGAHGPPSGPGGPWAPYWGPIMVFCWKKKSRLCRELVLSAFTDLGPLGHPLGGPIIDLKKVLCFRANVAVFPNKSPIKPYFDL